jgi:enamine deaminase RidA (YjgF/YER057c/UK114 family)
MHHLIDDLMVNQPASTLVQVPRLAQPDMQIEIETVVLL